VLVCSQLPEGPQQFHDHSEIHDVLLFFSDFEKGT